MKGKQTRPWAGHGLATKDLVQSGPERHAGSLLSKFVSLARPQFFIPAHQRTYHWDGTACWGTQPRCGVGERALELHGNRCLPVVVLRLSRRVCLMGSPPC